MTTARTALVIGAGIAGPVAAMALRRAGIQPTVYEAHLGGAESIGTFLTIASNGVDALRAIGADEMALAVGFPTPTIMLRSTTGKSLGGARTGLTLPDGTTSNTLKRADLYQALYQEAVRRGIEVQHGKRLATAERTSDGVRAATSLRGAKPRRSHRRSGSPGWPSFTLPTPAPRSSSCGLAAPRKSCGPAPSTASPTCLPGTTIA